MCSRPEGSYWKIPVKIWLRPPRSERHTWEKEHDELQQKGEILMKQVPFPEIPFDEFELRRKKAMKLLEEEGIDGLLLFNNQNLVYYFGFRKTWTFQWLHAGIMTKEGVAGTVIPQTMDEIVKQTTWLEDENVKPWGGAPHWGLPKDPVEAV